MIACSDCSQLISCILTTQKPLVLILQGEDNYKLDVDKLAWAESVKLQIYE